MIDTNFLFPLLLTFLAGMSTVIGGLISFTIKTTKKTYLYFTLGLSAGVMIYISLVELLPNSILKVGSIKANLAFFLGIVFFMIIDYLIPHQIFEEKHMKLKNKKLMVAGVFTAIGLTLHNFPEGVAVLFTSLDNLSLGIPLAVAVALHNIPEGIAVSMPIYYATKSRGKAVLYSFISGIAEPIGALIGFLFLFPFLNETILSLVTAFVAGTMIFISFDELLPLTLKDDKSTHLSIIGIIVGMLIMAGSIYLL
ncbi:MAG: zinc transporter ZupT [Candidatus Woesearchaeota archaeon]